MAVGPGEASAQASGEDAPGGEAAGHLGPEEVPNCGPKVADATVRSSVVMRAWRRGQSPARLFEARYELIVVVVIAVPPPPATAPFTPLVVIVVGGATAVIVAVATVAAAEDAAEYPAGATPVVFVTASPLAQASEDIAEHR